MASELTVHWGDQILEFLQDLSQSNENFPRRVLKLIAKHFEFNRMLFFLYAYSDIDIEKRSRRDALSNFVALNFDAELMNDYGSIVRGFDIFTPRHLPDRLKNQKVLYTDDVLPRAKYLETQYYAYMSSKGMEKQACIYLYHEKEIIGNICVFRSEGEPDFSDRDRLLMEYLSDVISSHYMMWLRLTEDVLSQKGFGLFFRGGKVGAVLLNSRLTVLMSNTMAQEHCADFVNRFGKENGLIARSSYQRGSQYQHIQQTIDLIGLDLIGSERLTYATFQEELSFAYWPLIITNIFGDVETRHLILSTRTKKKQGRAIQNLFDALTQRESEILKYVLAGEKNTEIAELLHISSYTVRTHISNIYHKFDVGSKAELLIKINPLER